MLRSPRGSLLLAAAGLALLALVAAALRMSPPAFLQRLGDRAYPPRELVHGWVMLMRSPTRADPEYGAYLRLAGAAAPGVEPYAAEDLFAVEGAGGNRMWLVPSLQIAIVCTGPSEGRDNGWSDSRIPNLIVRAARDFRPRGTQQSAEISTVVPGH